MLNQLLPVSGLLPIFLNPVFGLEGEEPREVAPETPKLDGPQGEPGSHQPQAKTAQPSSGPEVIAEWAHCPNCREKIRVINVVSRDREHGSEPRSEGSAGHEEDEMEEL